MIRVVVIDDHPALRAGLKAVLEVEPGFVFAGDNRGDEQLWPLLERARASVAIVDYHLADCDGLQLGWELRRRCPQVRTLLYTAYASPRLALPAAIAGFDAMVRKDAGAAELFDAIRLVHRGEHVLPAPSRAVVEEARERLDAQEQALIGLLSDGCTDAEAADALGLDVVAVDRTVRRLLGKLGLDVPTAPPE